MLGCFSDEIACASRSKRWLGCSASDFDGDGATQSCVYRSIDFDARNIILAKSHSLFCCMRSMFSIFLKAMQNANG